MVVPRTLAQTPVLLALGGETSGLAVLVHGVGDPVDSGVSADSLVVGAKYKELSERAKRESGAESSRVGRVVRLR